MINILFVDDDISMLYLYKVYLESTRYNPHTTNDTNIAIELLIKNAYKIIITDYFMPNVTGLEFALKVKTTCLKLNIKYPYTILASSEAFEDKHDKQRTIFNLILQKPLTRETLLSTLDSILTTKE
ncbi:response regulator [Solidesulfovibrio magneticus]|uniref:Response regulator receiver protein n=1 Tax=Solidesulfovibrio magneticus (strain ATCC 700980 / DSM 13731 / RS-1) TaxID=573370 RepID=C4XKZ8_SOLM1|nr:response regulator receiver protein [Solidesulfovibrio magneticus RS-1]